MNFDAEQFLEALPSLRLAFSIELRARSTTWASTMLEARGLDGAARCRRSKGRRDAARVHAVETRLFGLARYGFAGRFMS